MTSHTTSRITTRSPSASIALAPQSIGTVFKAGGALWTAHYALQLLAGGIEGKAAMESRFFLLDGLCFSTAIVAFCLALGLLCARLRPRATLLSTVGVIFAVIAAVAVLFGLGRYFLQDLPPGIFGAAGVIGSCLSATFVALAARSAHLPPRLWALLLGIGLSTFPLILAFIWPGQFVPAYLTDELPFALSGLAYFVFGHRLQKFNPEMI